MDVKRDDGVFPYTKFFGAGLRLRTSEEGVVMKNEKVVYEIFNRSGRRNPPAHPVG